MTRSLLKAKKMARYKYEHRLSDQLERHNLNNTIPCVQLKDSVQKMKLSTFFAALLPLTGASAKAIVGREITDPDRLSRLQELHANALDMLNSGTALPVTRSTNLTEHHAPHEKRLYQVMGLLGVYVASRVGAGALQQVLGEILEIFLGDDIIWQNKEHCRAFFATQGGGNEEFRTFARGSGDSTSRVNIK